ncbi:MAG: penicillin acylase family protein [Sphingomonadaceae bacterium]
MRTALGLVLGVLLASAAPACAFDRKAAIARASAYDGIIGRDAWGVPRVHGTRDADAAFALGYALAEDDFALVQEAMAAGNAHRLAARSQSEARISYLIQLFRVPELADEAWERMLSPGLKAYLDGYADGINLYAARHPKEISRPGLFPLTGKDIVRNAIFQSPLFYGMSGTLSRLVAPERQRSLEAGQGLQVRRPDRLQQAGFLLRGDAAGEPGSNAFAVAPSRSADGATRLIVNSHQPLEGPLAWLEASVSSEEGLEFTGGLFPGSPILLVGANPDMAWAATVNRPDLIDTFRLLVDPARPGMYRLDGAWLPFENGRAWMRVRLGPLVVRVSRRTRWSAHGPVLDTPDGPVAIRWATMAEPRGIETQYRLMRARSVAEARAILAENHMGSTYRIHADRHGAIARYYVARMPRRIDGPDWRGMLPGDRSDLIWQEFEPFEALPHLENPPEGWLTEANSSPFHQMGSASDPDPEAFPRRFGIETDLTNRARRATELMRGANRLDREALWAIKMDDRFHPDSLAATLHRQLLAADWAADPTYAEAVALLRAWDLGLAPDNRAAALAMLTFQPIGAALFQRQTPPDLRTSFEAAIATLRTHHGALAVPWSQVNRLHRSGVDRPQLGGPDVLRAASSALDPATGTLRTVVGDGLIILVEWDRDGRQTVSTLSPFGASGRPESPHHTDQMDRFVSGRLDQMRTVPMDRAAREAGLVRRYRPQDRP